MNFVLILSSVLLNCMAQLCMKKGMMGVGELSGGMSGLMSAIPSMITNGFLWISAACYVVSIVLWLVVLSRVDVSYAYPFLSIGYVVAAVVGYFAFAENLSPIRIAGIIVICIGVILISRS
ncbi:EamA family transporter [Oscillibacter valericigenes]|nr:EamA family transporter [Oscillibacter valericigenes]